MSKSKKNQWTYDGYFYVVTLDDNSKMFIPNTVFEGVRKQLYINHLKELRKLSKIK
jgi:hypothetical protein